MVSLGYIEDKGYLTIKDAAKILGVDKKTLRRWEESGTIRKARRMPPLMKYRVYTHKDIAAIKKLIERRENGK